MKFSKKSNFQIHHFRAPNTCRNMVMNVNFVEPIKNRSKIATQCEVLRAFGVYLRRGRTAGALFPSWREYLVS